MTAFDKSERNLLRMRAFHCKKNSVKSTIGTKKQQNKNKMKEIKMNERTARNQKPHHQSTFQTVTKIFERKTKRFFFLKRALSIQLKL